MTTPFPYHKLNRTNLQCLKCNKPSQTKTGPPYCTLHHTLNTTPPPIPQNPHLTKAAQQATKDIRLHRAQKALKHIQGTT